VRAGINKTLGRSLALPNSGPHFRAAVLRSDWGTDETPRYRTDAGPMSGPFRYRGAPKTIDVLDLRDEGGVVGVATLIGPGGTGVAHWRLVVRGVELEGRWIVASRKFCRHDLPPPVLPRAKVRVIQGHPYQMG
jgi:hypothetical protein